MIKIWTMKTDYIKPREQTKLHVSNTLGRIKQWLFPMALSFHRFTSQSNAISVSILISYEIMKCHYTLKIRHLNVCSLLTAVLNVCRPGCLMKGVIAFDLQSGVRDALPRSQCSCWI